ncbi:MAG: SurA N-terminal domain-containing protein [Alphaproteobacteria bacterium]|nr:SurA N-terminal domain-containing protein [Alphaproteobacteria bacterium]
MPTDQTPAKPYAPAKSSATCRHAAVAVMAVVALGIPLIAQSPATAAGASAGGSASAIAKTTATTSNVIQVRSTGTQGIAVLVNDDPITNYEIDQRQKYLSLGAGDIQNKARDKFKALISAKSTTEKLRDILRDVIKANPGKSKDEILDIFERRKKQFAESLQQQAVSSARASVLPGLRKQAVDELIDERLKLQEAKRLNVLAGDDEVDRLVGGIAERNKMDIEKFGKHMKSMGADVNSMRSRFKAMLSWKNVIRRQFGHQISISTQDLDRAVASADGDDKTELNVQLITLLYDNNLGQTELARRLREASELRTKFTGCSMTGTLAQSAGGARFSNLGPTEAVKIPEPTRTLLISASDGEMLPASVGGQGVELWVLCGRKTVGANDAKRDAAAEDLRQREFQVLAERHLNDLRQDAHIEYR